MKQTIILLLLLTPFLFESLHAQVIKLDVTGNSILRGKVDAHASVTDTTSLFIGKNAGVNDDEDNFNTALGLNALNLNTSGRLNTAIGHNALRANTIGGNNTAIGHLSLDRNTEGEDNTAIGFNSLGINTMGSNNTAMGLSSLLQNNLGDNNTALGKFALGSIRDGDDNTGIGYQALGFATSDASRNTAVGKESLFRTTSDGNVGVGWQTLFANTTGGGNTAVGGTALLRNSNGFGNTAIGDASMGRNTTGDNNTAIGHAANVGSDNLNNATAIGANAIVNSSNSLILGSGANVGIGTSSPLQKLHIIGDRMRLATVGTSGKYIELRTDGNDVDLSSTGARLYLNANSSDIIMQQSGNNTAIGDDASPDYKLEVVGDAGKTGGGMWTNSSDRRLKKDIEDYGDGLKEVLEIRPVWYRYNGMYGMPTEERYIGVIAQEIQEIAPYTVKRYMETNDETGEQAEYLNYNGTAVTYMLVNAVQEQQGIIEEKEIRIANLEDFNKGLQNRMAKIEALLELGGVNEYSVLYSSKTD